VYCYQAIFDVHDVMYDIPYEFDSRYQNYQLVFIVLQDTRWYSG